MTARHFFIIIALVAIAHGVYGGNYAVALWALSAAVWAWQCRA